MAELKFGWSSVKAESNKRKYGVSFDQAQTAFYDENARLLFDSERPIEEMCFTLLGMTHESQLIVVSHFYQDSDRSIGIMSARPATKRERQQYEDFLL